MALNVKRPERLVDVCLDGSLMAEWEATDKEYRSARAELLAAPDKRMNDPRAKRVDELLAKARELSKQARAETVTFRLRALPRSAWDELVTAHPARSKEKDGGFPFNITTITDAAMSTEGTIVSVERPDGAVEPFAWDDWEAFAEGLSSAQHEDFYVAVIGLNAGANEVPFLPESAQTTDSDKS
ncbi:hypothetical protein [Nesterenkonia jeotgali]|uniref:Tail assembly chaperone n=1 Tax=Nesterenkonia jeotgali TaxID=317018 RepID=A0A839FP68_9MICC|nr:hypothetical protein [Nesterenkonia jeotgali]MBA8920441.1 hypothetical protein [Nesterenkonia jeotgali]